MIEKFHERGGKGIEVPFYESNIKQDKDVLSEVLDKLNE